MMRRGPLLTGIISGVVAILVLVVLVLPKMGQVGKTKDKLAAAQEEQTGLQNELRSLQEAKQQAPKVQKELEKLDTEVPPTADLPGVIRLVSSAADRSAIDFFSISPGAPSADASGTFSIIQTQITVNGEFSAMEEFIYKLETLPRAVKVTSFTVNQGPGFTDGGPDEVLELTAQLTAEFYTSDSSAGPGSVPGPTQGTPGA